MDWIIAFVTVALLCGYIFLRRNDQISADAAVARLRQGAMIVDVRTPAEYAVGHIERAINLPLAEIDVLIAERIEDKGQVLLLHCQTGTRSAVAKNKLAALGYSHAYNLGSYERAERIADRIAERA